jgi:LmbE family N-acetylglucosaminyl deacetylase
MTRLRALAASAASVLALASPRASAEPPRQPSSGELARALDRLLVVGNVLYVAAHPDDENTRLLAYLENERLVRTGYLSLTRGDGGQNLIGSEQGALLGLIRTQELLAARGVDGAEQLFTRARDFGYSKTPEETLSIWGKDEVLGDVVWAMRRFKPDVVITRFPTGGIETHGHHTASAILAEQAFRLAGDPRAYPEQLAWEKPWQPQSIVWNKSQFFIKPGEDLSSFLRVDIGAFNPWLGVSYGEMAATSRSMHASQGFGAAAQRGPALEYFKALVGPTPELSLFEGVDLSWRRVPGSARLVERLERARADFRPERPEAAIPALLDARDELARLPDNPWKAPKSAELRDAIVACAGAWLEATAGEAQTTPGASLAITVSALNRSPAAVTLKELRLPGGSVVPIGKALSPSAPFELERAVEIPGDAPLTNPYWLEEAPSKGLYAVKDRRLVGLPEAPAPLAVDFVLAFGDRLLTVRRPVAFKWTDPVAGERRRPLEIAPAVMVNPAEHVMIFPDGAQKALRVVVKAGAAPARGTVRLEVPEGWRAEPASAPFDLAKKGDEARVSFRLTPPPHAAGAPPARGALHAIAEVGGRRYGRGVTRIDHPHIPIQTLFPEAEVELVRFDLARNRAPIGYIPGAGDEVPAALRQVGYDVTILGDEQLESAPLGRFAAIVVGVRAYNVDHRLPFAHARLMDYVAGGGTLVAQYATNNRISKTPAEIGPFPFEISQERVTDERAKVAFELPANAVLTQPNKLGEADFDGWVQERGLYFAGKWDARYEAPLSMHDAGEPARRGGLLVARHGKGAFVYTGLAFFRQLPAGVPGAYRLFANLLAYGKSGR